MELREHFGIINKYKWLIILLVILITLATFLFSFYQPEYYKVSTAFTVKSINKQVTTEYQYDGYYSIKAAELFSQTIISWFMTPSVLVEIYEKAGIDPKIDSLDKFTSRFKTKQYSAQNFVVTFKERDRKSAEAVSSSIISLVEENSQDLSLDANQNALFEVEGATPVIIKSKVATWLVTLVAFVFSLIIAVAISYLINYVKTEGVSKGGQ